MESITIDISHIDWKKERTNDSFNSWGKVEFALTTNDSGVRSKVEEIVLNLFSYGSYLKLDFIYKKPYKPVGIYEYFLLTEPIGNYYREKYGRLRFYYLHRDEWGRIWHTYPKLVDMEDLFLVEKIIILEAHKDLKLFSFWQDRSLKHLNLETVKPLLESIN